MNGIFVLHNFVRNNRSGLVKFLWIPFLVFAMDGKSKKLT